MPLWFAGLQYDMLHFVVMLLVSFRVLSIASGSSVTQVKRNGEETCKPQTYARLKALLQFYQESEVITPVLISLF